jgi:hypothetical protein
MSKTSLKAQLRSHRDAYLRRKGTAAGYAAEAKQELIAEYDRTPDAWREYILEALLGTYDSVWREDTDDEKDDDGRQFILAGFPIRRHLRFPAAGVPGGYLTVLSEFATVRQLDASARLKLSKANEAQSRALQEMIVAEEAIRRAGGDLDKLLYDVVDVEPIAAK